MSTRMIKIMLMKVKNIVQCLEVKNAGKKYVCYTSFRHNYIAKKHFIKPLTRFFFQLEEPSIS